ncbi:hypothetical protein FRX31_034785 [Thalictrum thalictroides]|uniref:DUF4283 domain-containing protein n=1 Tax=Thalictrum thalictroides TaxID=46969 RepID=A0A7J6UT07_THATH|nr:hypothetical protein FRX31_034785 [Thalictrum thalictroides]
MVIRPWSEDVYEERENITSVPIWVKCYDIPMQLWSPAGLSLIGSKIGNPKCCDEITMKRERLDFARLCIEVKADTTYPTTLRFNLGEGKKVVVGVEYTWKPHNCSNCKVFGHTVRNCTHHENDHIVHKEADVNNVDTQSAAQPGTWVVQARKGGASSPNMKRIATSREEEVSSSNRYGILEEEEDVTAQNFNDNVVVKQNAIVVVEVQNAIVAVEEQNEFVVEEEQNDMIAVVEPLDVRGKKNLSAVEEVVPCSLVEEEQEPVEGEDMVEQFRAEQLTYHDLCKDGKGIQTPLPDKEVEIFSDHIIKTVPNKPVAMKPKGSLQGAKNEVTKKKPPSNVVTNVEGRKTRASGKSSSKNSS